jgi:hypothetical protein
VKIIRYTRLRKVKIGDQILGYGVVTAVNGNGTLQTDTGYRWLSFGPGKSVPVIATDLLVVA